ncbi:MAG TPA: hypothetical protein VFY81_09390 [Gammaproteobacteria bacterium]|nr:hypothetical protein [Gammaproteobacteria bacterium]
MAELDWLKGKIAASEAQLDEWIQSSPHAGGFQPAVYAAIRARLKTAQQQESIDDLEAVLRGLSRHIVDSGPLTGAFLPALEEAQLALAKRREHLAKAIKAKKT